MRSAGGRWCVVATPEEEMLLLLLLHVCENENLLNPIVCMKKPQSLNVEPLPLLHLWLQYRHVGFSVISWLMAVKLWLLEFLWEECCQSLIRIFSNSPVPLPICFVRAVTSLKYLIGSTDQTACQRWKSEAWGEQGSWMRTSLFFFFFFWFKECKCLSDQREESACLAFQLLRFITFNFDSALFL